MSGQPTELPFLGAVSYALFAIMRDVPGRKLPELPLTDSTPTDLSPLDHALLKGLIFRAFVH